MEYALKDNDGDGLFEYAERFLDDEERKTVSTGRQRKARKQARWGLWPQRQLRQDMGNKSLQINPVLTMVTFSGY